MFIPQTRLLNVISFVFLLSGCAFNNVGVVSSKSYFSSSAEIVELKAFGLHVDTDSKDMDVGVGLGFRKKLLVYPICKPRQETNGGVSENLFYHPQKMIHPVLTEIQNYGIGLHSFLSVNSFHIGYSSSAFVGVSRNDSDDVNLRIKYQKDDPSTAEVLIKKGGHLCSRI